MFSYQLALDDERKNRSEAEKKRNDRKRLSVELQELREKRQKIQTDSSRDLDDISLQIAAIQKQLNS